VNSSYFNLIFFNFIPTNTFNSIFTHITPLPNQWVETNQLFLENYLAILAKEAIAANIFNKPRRIYTECLGE
jgi:hypothetical protein